MEDKLRTFSLSFDQKHSLDMLVTALESDDADVRCNALRDFAYTLVGEELDSGLPETHPLFAFIILRSMTAGALFAKPEVVTPILASLEWDIRLVIWLHMNKLVDNAPIIGNRKSLTLFATLKTEHQWVQEGKPNVWSWVVGVQRLASSYAYKATKPARFLWAVDGSSFKYKGETILWESWLELIQDALHDVQHDFQELWTDLGLNLEILLPLSCFEDLEDALDNQSTNYTFSKAQGNQWIEAQQTKAWQQLADSNKFCRVVDGKLKWLPAVMKETLKKHRRLLVKMAYAMYLFGGQPPRGTELMHSQWRNTPGRIRNLFMYFGILICIGFLNKTTFLQKMDKPIPRGYPPDLGLIIVNYFVFFRMFELHFALELDLEKTTQSVNSIHRCNSRVFVINGEELTTVHLTEHLKQKTEKILKVREGLGTSDMRHIIISIGGKKVTSPIAIAETSAMHLQAGHNSSVAKQHYGIDFAKFADDVSQDVIDEFLGCTKSHWKVYKLRSLEEVCHFAIVLYILHSNCSCFRR